MNYITIEKRTLAIFALGDMAIWFAIGFAVAKFV